MISGLIFIGLVSILFIATLLFVVKDSANHPNLYK